MYICCCASAAVQRLKSWVWAWVTTWIWECVSKGFPSEQPGREACRLYSRLWGTLLMPWLLHDAASK